MQLHLILLKSGNMDPVLIKIYLENVQKRRFMIMIYQNMAGIFLSALIVLGILMLEMIIIQT